MRAPRARVKPNSMAPAKAVHGRHLPKMRAARAMKPVPLVMLSSKPACDSSENQAPASPAIRPPITTAL